MYNIKINTIYYDIIPCNTSESYANNIIQIEQYEREIVITIIN